MIELNINGHDFRITRETIHGAQGFSLREWTDHNVLHDFGCTEKEARQLAEDIAGCEGSGKPTYTGTRSNECATCGERVSATNGIAEEH